MPGCAAFLPTLLSSCDQVPQCFPMAELANKRPTAQQAQRLAVQCVLCVLEETIPLLKRSSSSWRQFRQAQGALRLSPGLPTTHCSKCRQLSSTPWDACRFRTCTPCRRHRPTVAGPAMPVLQEELTGRT
jgi:hypothetical protein